MKEIWYKLDGKLVSYGLILVSFCCLFKPLSQVDLDAPDHEANSLCSCVT